MRAFQGTRVKRWMYSKTTSIILLSATIFAAYSAHGLYQKSRQAKNNLEESRAKLAELLERKEALEKELAGLEGSFGLEMKIREKLPVIKEGEGVIQIIDERGTTSNVIETEVKRWWQLWK